MISKEFHYQTEGAESKLLVWPGNPTEGTARLWLLPQTKVGFTLLNTVFASTSISKEGNCWYETNHKPLEEPNYWSV